jgi:hypothetical protein
MPVPIGQSAKTDKLIAVNLVAVARTILHGPSVKKSLQNQSESVHCKKPGPLVSRT